MDSTRQATFHTEVLIVGAGPTGLALSAELRRRGVEAITIDRLSEGLNTSRAAVVHARTLEVLEPLGVVPAMLHQGLKVAIFRVRDRDRVLLTIDFTSIPSAYAFTLMCPQNRAEAILLARLRESGGEVVRPAQAIALRSEPNGVQVDFAAMSGATHTVHAQWVVGCDGMHSMVRERAGIAFPGEAYEQSFVLADVHMAWPLAIDEVSLFLSPEGLVVVAPLPEQRYRIVATMDNAPEHPTTRDVQALVDARGPESPHPQIHDVVWASRFRVHRRIAESPRRGRVLLCGDAAHVHSPAGGQGMNTGVQDAMSLAAALAETRQGASEDALNSWAAARHRVAEDVLVFTDRMTRMATIRSPALRTLRNAAIGLAGHFPFLITSIASRIAELESPQAASNRPK